MATPVFLHYDHAVLAFDRIFLDAVGIILDQNQFISQVRAGRDKTVQEFFGPLAMRGGEHQDLDGTVHFPQYLDSRRVQRVELTL